MKTNTHRLFAILSALALGAGAVRAWDFSYTYQTVNSANAMSYVVGTQNLRTVNDWTGSTYWGPYGNDVQATVTSKFTFSAATTEIFMHSRIQAYNWGSHYGFTSLWGSTDGNNWQLILNDPTPSTYGSGGDTVYNQDLPLSFTGSTAFWLQARMQQHGAIINFSDPAAAWTDSQYSRYDGPGINPPSTGNIFELDAMVVPEPAAWQFGLAAFGVAWGFAHRNRR
jgi:hypothetical protein